MNRQDHIAMCERESAAQNKRIAELKHEQMDFEARLVALVAEVVATVNRPLVKLIEDIRHA